MSEIAKKLLEKVPHSILKNLFFTSTWEPPIEIINMNQEEKYELLKSIKHLNETPTETNNWFWFGTYNMPSVSPRYNAKSAALVLHRYLISDVPVGKLVPAGFNSKHKLDVNPYKYIMTNTAQVMVKASPALIKDAIETALTPDNYMTTTAQKNDLSKLDHRAKQALESIDEWYMPNFYDTKEAMTRVLTDLNYDQTTIELAFEYTTKELK